MRHLVRIASGAALALALLSPSQASAQTSDSASLDPSARLASDGSASEQWDLVAHLDSGHEVFARFLITNMGPGDENGVAIGHVVTPEGDTHEFHNGRRKGSWKLEDDGLYVGVGSSHLELGGPSSAQAGRYRLDVEKDDVLVDLPFGPNAARALPAEALPTGIHSDLLALGAPTRARVWVPGMEEPIRSGGRVTLTHTWTDRSEAKLTLRRIELVGRQEGRSVYWSEVTAPDGSRTGWIAVQDDSGETFFSVLPGANLTGVHPAMSGSRYWLPRRVTFVGPLSGKVRLGSILLEHDPLGDLPQPFRWIVGMTMRPRRVWARADFHVTLPPDPQPPLVKSGVAVMVVTFLNPIEAPAKTGAVDRSNR